MMFIRLRNENYINTNEIKIFCLTHGDEPIARAVEKNGEVHDVKSFSNRHEAEKWLADLVAELNGGKVL